MKIKKIHFPVLVLLLDKTIDCKGANKVKAPVIYIRKGRTLTLKNIGDGEFNLEYRVLQGHGNLRVARKPVELSAEELRKKINENKES